MNNSPRMKLLTLCIGAALAQMGSLPALADSGVGVDTIIGNKANPGYAAGIPVESDPDSPPVQRTPTGQMYSYPPLKDDVAKGQATGSVDVGFTNNSDKTRNSKRGEYADTRDGVIVNNFGLAADSDAARYFSVNGGGVGRSDQFYDVTVGKYNSWKVKAFYNETTHVFTDTWKSFYSGEGTGNMTHGLAMPTMVTNGTYTTGAAGYVGVGSTCSAALPCWSYNGVVYSNLAAHNGGNANAAAVGINGVGGAIAAGTNALTVFSGAGVSGATQTNLAAAINAKLAATPYSELSLVRKKTGMRADVNLTDAVKGFVSYGVEKRIGSRPLAMNDNNVSVEIAEPIDYQTHDVMAGLSYNDGLTQANLRTSASLFRNSIKELNVQYPMLDNAMTFGALQHATFALAPNNDSYNIKGELARDLPDLMKGRFTAAASWGSNRQNDTLLNPISAMQSADLAAAGVTSLVGVVNPGYNAAAGTTGAALVNNWNGVNGSPLSRSTAGQRIDNKMVDLGLTLKPVDDLSMKGFYRFFETDNKGGYLAYNPLTGQFGRGFTAQTNRLEVMVAPGTGTGCYAPAGSGFTAPAACNATLAALANGVNLPVFGQARSTRQYNYGVSADYDLNSTSSLNGAIEREDVHRTFRERAKTEENKVKLGYVNRALGETTLRVSYEKDRKRGSNYSFRTFEDLGPGLPGLSIPTQIALAGTGTVGVTPQYAALATSGALLNMYSIYFRKYDLANRNQDTLNARVNYQATADLDVGLNLQAKKADYPEGMYGLKKDNQNSLGIDMSYQPTYDSTVTAFYNYQAAKKSMNNNASVAVNGTACTATNLATYGYAACTDTTDGINGARPDSSKWSSDTTDKNHVIGLGLQEDLGFARLGIDYTYARSSTHIAYNYAAGVFNANNTTALQTTSAYLSGIAANALPDMTTVQNTITVNLVKPLDKKTTVRAMYRFDGLRIKDWHYDNVLTGKMAAFDGGTMLMDAGPLNYHVNTFGVFLNYKL